jgi:exosortase
MTLAVALAAVAGGALYLSLAVGLIAQWTTDPGAAHGIFVVGAAVLVAVRRHRAAAAPRPAAAGFILLAIAMSVYLTGTLTGDLFVQRVSLPLTIAAAVVITVGWTNLQVFAGPLILLTLAIPLPAVLITSMTLPLQLLASTIAAWALNALSVDVVRHGNLLVLNQVTLEVANVCSGLRSIIALLSLAAVTVTVFPFTPVRRALLLAAVLPVAVIGNGLRIAVTGVLASQIGVAAVRGLVHELTGFAGFVAMCAVLFGIAVLSRRADADAGHQLPRAV